jgi:hypothetical protein
MCCPAPSALANQAFEPFPHPERAEVVNGREEQKCQEERETPAKCPLLRLDADRAAANRLNGIEKEMSAIQHRDWQEVDESEIN